MSVIINGMTMPETCYECRFCEYHSVYPFKPFCVAHINAIEDPRSGRLDTCPLEDYTAEFISVPCESYFKVICSKCGREPIDNEDTAFYWLTPYCPFCGRKIVRMDLKDRRKE